MSPIRAEPDRPLNRPLAVNGIVSVCIAKTMAGHSCGWRWRRDSRQRQTDAGDGRFVHRAAGGWSYRDNAIDALYGITCLTDRITMMQRPPRTRDRLESHGQRSVPACLGESAVFHLVRRQQRSIHIRSLFRRLSQCY